MDSEKGSRVDIWCQTRGDHLGVKPTAYCMSATMVKSHFDSGCRNISMKRIASSTWRIACFP